MRRGFTLLEVMIALGILAVSLVAIANLNGGSLAMHAYSRRASQATLLLRGKMLDVEEELQRKGFSDFSDEKHGTFDDEGAPGVSWKAEILKPDVQLDPAQLLSLIGGTGGGKPDPAASASKLAGSLAGNPDALKGLQTGGAASALAGPLGGMLSGQATTFIETLKKSVREIRLTVSWQDGHEARNISASQLVVILPESVGKDPQAAAPAATNPATGIPVLPGAPGAPPPPQPPGQQR